MPDNENIFKSYMDSNPLFRGDRDILRPTYIPEDLPHREKQIQDLASIMVTALRGNRPSNVLIFGKTGTGKTAVVRYLEREVKRLKRESADSNLDNKFSKHDIDKVEYVYVNCEVVDTHYGVMKNIGNKFVEEWSDQIPFTGWPMEKVYESLRDSIEEEPRVVVIILDELDKLVTKSGDSVLYHLSKINSELEKSKVSLIGISNNLKFTELLDPRVKSRLGEEKMIFPPYDAEQLKDILSDRAEKAFEPDILGNDVISLCSALAAQEHGDARRALDLLRISAELAERNNDTCVNTDHVYKAKNKIEENCVREAVNTLPTHSKLVLYSILLMQENGKDKLTTGEVYSGYKELGKRSGIDPLTQRRITDLISELDMLGLINARVKSFGRRGRTKEIQSSVSEADIIDLIEDDEGIEPVRDLKTQGSKQTTLI
ncbi:MAG: ORC1-type DNA replication protein [Candidatus Thermoplasmatota archaeon]|nr:ORC1-type DNA replication protein [Candidatus Thermoplasmatota archaeon]